MVYLGTPYHFKFFKGCLPQILLGSFLNTLTQMNQQSWTKHWRLFHFLVQFFFTTSETEPGYYHQKVNVRVVSQVPEQLKT